MIQIICCVRNEDGLGHITLANISLNSNGIGVNAIISIQTAKAPIRPSNRVLYIYHTHDEDSLFATYPKVSGEERRKEGTGSAFGFRVFLLQVASPERAEAELLRSSVYRT